MGLFNFFKKKDQGSEKKTGINSSGPYLGDLNKTNSIYQLIQTPKAERDEKWQSAFLQNIAQASFRCGEPQVITGPDGFPYFQLFLPEPHKSFQCYVIDRMKDDFLLSKGFGVVINPSSNNADWVLSYGDILNFQLNGTFYTTGETAFSNNQKSETIHEEEEVMIGQPSETILPKQTRRLIREFLKTNGVKHPKILLMMRHKKEGTGVSQELVFNVTPKDFNSDDRCRNVMQAINWYLPRHYSFASMSEESIQGFMPL
jgi:hypothetical protein